MDRNLPEDFYGPRTEIREYSFFNNSKMTPRVRDDRVVVELCASGTAECSDGREPAKLQVGHPRLNAHRFPVRMYVEARLASNGGLRSGCAVGNFRHDKPHSSALPSVLCVWYWLPAVLP